MGREQWVAASQLLIACLLGVGIWVLLPARWLPVDLIGSAAALLSLLGGGSLLLRKPWGTAVSRAASWTLLCIGCVTFSALAFTAAHLSGLYGPVGSGGALLMGTVAALILPYLVGLPALQLHWLRR